MHFRSRQKIIWMVSISRMLFKWGLWNSFSDTILCIHWLMLTDEVASVVELFGDWRGTHLRSLLPPDPLQPAHRLFMFLNNYVDACINHPWDRSAIESRSTADEATSRWNSSFLLESTHLERLVKFILKKCWYSLSIADEISSNRRWWKTRTSPLLSEYVPQIQPTHLGQVSSVSTVPWFFLCGCMAVAELNTNGLLTNACSKLLLCLIGRHSPTQVSVSSCKHESRTVDKESDAVKAQSDDKDLWKRDPSALAPSSCRAYPSLHVPP